MTYNVLMGMLNPTHSLTHTRTHARTHTKQVHRIRRPERSLLDVSQQPRCYVCKTTVAEWLGRWTCDQQVAGSNPGLPVVECNPGQKLLTHVCLCHQAV